jgi:hypothetical protein
LFLYVRHYEREIEGQSVSLDEKKKILEEVDGGINKGDVTRKYGISPLTVSVFLKDREKIKRNIDSDPVGPYRKTCTVDNEVDKAVHRWFLDTQPKNILVNGPMLCKQA